MRYITYFQGIMAHLLYILIYKGFTFIFSQLFLKIKKRRIFFIVVKIVSCASAKLGCVERNCCSKGIEMVLKKTRKTLQSLVKSFFVGMTGFEPATTRPPDAYSNRAELHPAHLRLQRYKHFANKQHFYRIFSSALNLLSKAEENTQVPFP